MYSNYRSRNVNRLLSKQKMYVLTKDKLHIDLIFISSSIKRKPEKTRLKCYLATKNLQNRCAVSRKSPVALVNWLPYSLRQLYRRNKKDQA